MRPMVEIEGLTKKYGDLVAVRDLTLEIPEGELFGLLGPNGAGKTTTIGMLTGQIPITSGKARIDGLDVMEDALAIKWTTGCLPEEPFLYGKLTGWEYLDFVGSIYRLQPRKRSAKIEGLLDLFDMSEFQNDWIETYSFGMRKKVAICSTLLHNPRVLFWDDPIGGLDAKTNFIIKQLLRKLHQQGVTVILSTHILAVAEEVCDRVGIIHKGRLEAVGSVEDLRDREDQSLEEIFLKLTGEFQVEKKIEVALGIENSLDR